MKDAAQDNVAEQRYELTIGGETAIAAYRREGDALVFYHTLVPPHLEGQGIASRLVKGALDDVRAQGLKIVPACAFVAAYLERHPEERDLKSAR